jgi:hypothetical protein
MSGLDLLLSEAVGPLGSRVAELVRQHADLWRRSAEEPPPLATRFGRRAKKACEKELSDLVGRLSSEETRAALLGGSPDEGRVRETVEAVRPGLRRLLDLTGLPLEAVYDERFVDSTRRFLQDARDFDPRLRLDAAYQALRNVWIMNSLQFDLDLPIEPTEAVFAYSLVYPYLDNVLDDEAAAEADKLALLAKLKAWLEGSDPAPASASEERLRTLVGRMEHRFPREAFPAVYRSLLAIYNAQVRSLLQQRRPAAAPPEGILTISLEKGGTSVLADGYLVAGALDPADEEFCFGFGTFLQLADDLQDIAEDERRGHRTVFSSGAGRASIDAAAARLENYLAAVLARARRKATPRRAALCDAIAGGMMLLFRESVGRQPERFGRACVRRARRGFPVRFSYLEKLRRGIRERTPPGIERLADLDPALVALLAVSSRAFALDEAGR